MTKLAKTALVTGGAKRIGKAIALDLAAHGWAIAIHCNTSREAAEELAAAIEGGGGSACVVQANLDDRAAVAGLIDDARGQIGPLSLLVNNASLFEEDTLDDFDDEVWDRHFNVHVMATSRLATDFARQAEAAGNPMVVNIIDQRVWKPNPRFYSYTLSKSALWTATRTMAQALAPKVRVNAIGPGPTLPSWRQTDEEFESQLKTLLLETGPKLEEFGRAIRAMADLPSMTGQMIALDGGQHLMWETDDVRGPE